MRELSCAASTVLRMSAGAGMTTNKKPKPSSARKTNKGVASFTQPPLKLATDNNAKPINMLRRRPKLSAPRPTAKPSVMLAICTADNKKPACTKLMPSASCNTGTAGGSLATCKAAHTPANTMTQEGWMPKRWGVMPRVARVRGWQSGRSCPRGSRPRHAAHRAGRNRRAASRVAAPSKARTTHAPRRAPSRWSA